jgi:hypothetical protein
MRRDDDLTREYMMLHVVLLCTHSRDAEFSHFLRNELYDAGNTIYRNSTLFHSCDHRMKMYLGEVMS